MNRDERREAKQNIEKMTGRVIEAYRHSTKAGEAVESLVEAYGYEEAVKMVATVINRVSLGDGRIYDGVREWAQSQDAPTNEEMHGLDIYGVDTHIHSAHVNEIGLAMKKFEPKPEEPQLTAEQLNEYERKHGAEAAADLLALCPVDRFSGDYSRTAARLQERAKAKAEREAKEAETFGENFRHCKSIVDELEEVASGSMYRCPHCGEYYNIEDAEETEEGHICPGCKEEIGESEFEQASFYDWFADVLDIEYRIGSDGTYRSCRLMVACGGPNIYVDTGEAAVQLYWWGDRATAYFTRDTAEEIDSEFADLYGCTR